MALMLSRYEGESIRIGDDVTITIAAVRGSKVSVMVSAPREMKVLRTELIGTRRPPGWRREGRGR